MSYSIHSTIIGGNIDTAPIKSVALSGTVSCEAATLHILRFKDYDLDELSKLRAGDGIVADGQLMILNNIPHLKYESGTEPAVLCLSIDPARLPSLFADETFAWALGNNQSKFPKCWSLVGDSYSIDGVDFTTPMNFEEGHNLVLVDATNDVTISSGESAGL